MEDRLGGGGRNSVMHHFLLNLGRNLWENVADPVCFFLAFLVHRISRQHDMAFLDCVNVIKYNYKVTKRRVTLRLPTTTGAQSDMPTNGDSDRDVTPTVKTSFYDIAHQMFEDQAKCFSRKRSNKCSLCNLIIFYNYWRLTNQTIFWTLFHVKENGSIFFCHRVN